MFNQEKSTARNEKVQLIAAWLVLGTVIWEAFSLFGMRSLFILYLTKQLHYSDVHAYSLFGAYMTLMALTPLIGGTIADRFLGFKNCVIIGSALMVIGHILLALPTNSVMFAALSFLIIGGGFFTTNAISFIGSCYQDNAKRQSAMDIYYVVMNIGGTFGPIVCASMASTYSWRAGFLVAGVGMFLGLVTMLVAWRYFPILNGKSKTLSVNKKYRGNLIGLLAIAASIIAIDLTLRYDLTLYAVILVSLFGLYLAINLYRKANKKTKSALLNIFILTLVATVFWVMDQQGASSLSLFIDRYVDRNIHLTIFGAIWQSVIPAAFFQAINPAIIVVFGIGLAWFWQKYTKNNRLPKAATRVSIGIVLLILGFCCIDFGSFSAISATKISPFWVIGAFSVIAMGELFIDPVIMSEIGSVLPAKDIGKANGFYYLFVGAIANYTSAQVAKLTTTNVFNIGHDKAMAKATPTSYFECYVFFTSLVVIMLLVFVCRNRWAHSK